LLPPKAGHRAELFSRYIFDTVEKHPDADSLYIEQVDVGEESPRTIISGLVKYMTLEQMKGSRIVVVVRLPSRLTSRSLLSPFIT
jgi:tRNA-binding EMAP/Myf-like protein